MSKRSVNKDKQNSFLNLELSDQIRVLNNAVAISNNTESIIKELGFSYSWVSKVMEAQKVYYVSSIKRFVKVDNGAFTEKEILELKSIILDYEKFKESIRQIDDVRLCAGKCKSETITRSIILDKDINDKFNKFTKKYNFITLKDFFTSAIDDFINKYDKD
ncbi:hypothetical protein PMW00_06280 [Clostridium paraputrificum]|uniref:hypothetical protein n=1 Tax=Clostridium paraputrificum TaxID=29363 RepID=UPI002331386C|nr:hypothetical protein [Clostridium paraputrificum]MDB2102630.1 hypothetical protein [Clostridium paraputrificum]